MDLIDNAYRKVNRKMHERFVPIAKDGCRSFAFEGGRRSGKTYYILQRLISQCLRHRGMVVNVASMTAEQGRLGAYQDTSDLLTKSPALDRRYVIGKSPREVRFWNGSRFVFNSYQNPETAKGIACDWLFVNEANNFTQQQYTDLLANVRVGTFIDYNPNTKFWVGDFFDDRQIIHSTWQDNEYLTAAQRAYFDRLKANAEKPNASPLDIRNYLVYYCGQYAELQGTIFNSGNLRIIKEQPIGLKHWMVFCDPSALCGSDFFACVLVGMDGAGNMYVVDTWSKNVGDKADVVAQIKKWCSAYDVKDVYVETNGYIGREFYEFISKGSLPVRYWNSSINKVERICAHYEEITSRVYFCHTEHLQPFLDQCYEFSSKCEHDDNIDAVNSAWTIENYLHPLI